MDDDLFIHIERRKPVSAKTSVQTSLYPGQTSKYPSKENRTPAVAPSFLAKRFDPSALSDGAGVVKKKSKKKRQREGNALVSSPKKSKKQRTAFAQTSTDAARTPGVLQPSPGAATSSSTTTCFDEFASGSTRDDVTTKVKDWVPSTTVTAGKKKVHGDGAFELQKKTRKSQKGDRSMERADERSAPTLKLGMDEFESGNAVQLSTKKKKKKAQAAQSDEKTEAPLSAQTAPANGTHGLEKDKNAAAGRNKKKRRGLDKSAPEVLPEAGPAVRIVAQESVFSGQSFESVKLLDVGLARQLKYREFTTMTPVQSKALPVALEGKDVMIKAPTGSGKTLSFLIPLINRIVAQGKSDRSNGTVALVLSPTKELCVQSHQVCMKLTTMLPWLVSNQISGGENPKSEKSRLRKGVHILFATPGRITYHMENSSGWKIATNLCCFVMDEADRLLDLGFEKQVKQIYRKIVQPRGAQTLLVSATLTEAVKQLGEFCLKEDHTFVCGQGEESDQWAIPASLSQWCVELPAKKRLAGLISLLLEKKKKSIVFFSSCAQVDFHYDLFQEIRWPELDSKKERKPQTKLRDVGQGFVGIDARSEEDIDMEDVSDRPRVFSSLKVFKLHGDLKAEERNGFIADFAKEKNGVLLASDVVARGIDLPSLDWIIQYDPPRQLEEYLHRVGRAARMGRAGDSCLFLQPQEMPYIDVLKNKGVNLKAIDSTKLCEKLRQNLPNHDPLLRVRDLSSFLGSSIAKHVEARPLLLQVARKAFWSWMRGYQTFPRDLKPIFNYRNLHSGHIAASFALNEAPTKVFSGLKRDATAPKERKKGTTKAVKRMKKHSFVDEFAT